MREWGFFLGRGAGCASLENMSSFFLSEIETELGTFFTAAA